MPSRLASLSSRPTHLKALPGGLVCDSCKTPPPRRKIIKRGLYLGQEGCEDDLDRGVFFIKLLADDSLSCASLLGSDRVDVDVDAALVLTDRCWMLMSGRTYPTSSCIVDGAQN